MHAPSGTGVLLSEEHLTCVLDLVCGLVLPLGHPTRPRQAMYIVLEKYSCLAHELEIFSPVCSHTTHDTMSNRHDRRTPSQLTVHHTYTARTYDQQTSTRAPVGNGSTIPLSSAGDVVSGGFLGRHIKEALQELDPIARLAVDSVSRTRQAAALSVRCAASYLIRHASGTPPGLGRRVLAAALAAAPPAAVVRVCACFDCARHRLGCCRRLSVSRRLGVHGILMQ